MRAYKIGQTMVKEKRDIPWNVIDIKMYRQIAVVHIRVWGMTLFWPNASLTFYNHQSPATEQKKNEEKKKTTNKMWMYEHKSKNENRKLYFSFENWSKSGSERNFKHLTAHQKSNVWKGLPCLPTITNSCICIWTVH